MSVQIISFYLPQFYPFPENDEWWGKGFTEWTNVTKAKPLFDGHYQPHLPTDMGFYDLRVREAQHEQIALAKNYGIDGFCFHYYWFDGKRLLEKPVDAFLTDPQADIPFCLCWANENWTRRWDAAEREVLIAQSYSPGWEERFVDGLVPFFGDKRYIRVDGKPVLIVYRPQHIPDARLAGQRWRKYCREIGVGEIHIVSALTHGNENYEQYDFDAGVEFPPHNMRVSSVNEIVPSYAPYNGYAVEYAEVAEEYIRRNHRDRMVYRTVFPSWDNTARIQDRALIVLGATVENYERWLKQAVSCTEDERSSAHQLVFVNAWNEWAEGCHLEPDREFGRGFLEATLRVKQGLSAVGGGYEFSPLRKRAAKVSEPAALPGRIALKWKVAAYLHNRPLALSVARRIYRMAVGFARLSRRASR
jgi:lipopolysaccharide biosynthesis protein